MNKLAVFLGALVLAAALAPQLALAQTDPIGVTFGPPPGVFIAMQNGDIYSGQSGSGVWSFEGNAIGSAGVGGTDLASGMASSLFGDEIWVMARSGFLLERDIRGAWAIRLNIFDAPGSPGPDDVGGFGGLGKSAGTLYAATVRGDVYLIRGTNYNLVEYIGNLNPPVPLLPGSWVQVRADGR